MNVVAADTAASVAFYERLGVRFDTGGPPEWAVHHRNGHLGEGADVDVDSVPFAAEWNAGSTGAGVVLGFRTDTREEVDELFAELTGAGHPALQEPFDAFWGSRFAVVADPDGNAIGLMSPPDGAHRSPPPAPPST